VGDGDAFAGGRWDDGVSDCAPYADEAWSTGAGYPDGGSERRKYRYNALVVDFLDAPEAPTPGFSVAGPALPHSFAAASGCHQAGCPGGDDDAEGNSHPFWPYAAFQPGRPHAGPHATRLVSIGYGPAPEVLVRSFRLVDADASGLV
ncbi:MAG TPA: hypothetical protein VNX21_07525, partial [Candidatus Thermoplasmatota archaeon]|nr:hypothetical protein [Candidatus Thermoplasmatota archaeon]